MITKQELKKMGSNIPDSEIIEELQQTLEDMKIKISEYEDELNEKRNDITDLESMLVQAKTIGGDAATALKQYDPKTAKEIIYQLEDI